MKLKYFKENSYLELLDSVPENINKYRFSEVQWIDSFFQKENYYKESNINAVLPDSLYGKSFEDDIVSVRMVYDSLKDVLNPKQASSELLWSYLSHTKYWEYTKNRWIDKDASIDTIKSRFFCSSTRSGKADRRGLLRNSISRLYWFGYLSYDEDRKNKYELTELLLSKSDLCQNIIDRNYSMNKYITRGILLGIKEYIDKTGQEILEQQWRSFCKYLNRYGAVALLDVMSEHEVQQLTYDYLSNRNS